MWGQLSNSLYTIVYMLVIHSITANTMYFTLYNINTVLIHQSNIFTSKFPFNQNLSQLILKDNTDIFVDYEKIVHENQWK